MKKVFKDKDLMLLCSVQRLVYLNFNILKFYFIHVLVHNKTIHIT